MTERFAAKISVGQFGATVSAGGGDEDGRLPSLMTAGGLSDADRAFLLAPKQRQFDPFGQSLGGKLGRLVTRDDGLDNGGSQERQPHQSPDVVRAGPLHAWQALQPSRSTRQQIVSPLASPGDRFEEREIGQRSWCATALDDQPHLETAPPDLHRKDARDGQLGGARTLPFCRDGDRQLERDADACIDEVDAIDQGRQRRRRLRPPIAGASSSLRRVRRGMEVGSPQDRSPARRSRLRLHHQASAGRRRDGAFDLWRWQAPTAPALNPLSL